VIGASGSPIRSSNVRASALAISSTGWRTVVTGGTAAALHRIGMPYTV
jgi:hypothetical protein